MVQTDGTPLIYDRESTPLWMPRYDGVANMDFFVPFGNWTTAYMKQYSEVPAPQGGSIHGASTKTTSTIHSMITTA